MLLRTPPEVLLLLVPVLLFALCFHEFAHAWMANKLGDPTAKHSGRLTLNPLAHLDPMGTLMILFIGFGWAKPVPVNAYNLKNPKTDMMKIAFAGPGSNLLIAFFVLFFAELFSLTNYMNIIIPLYWINIALAIFNMLPISPKVRLPNNASIMEWIKTSPSLCPSNPSS